MIAEYQQALQLAVTAGAGDIATGALLTYRRRLAARLSGEDAVGPTAPPSVDLGAIGWGAMSTLLVAVWTRFGYSVEATDLGRDGVVDFILSDMTGYTYVSARHWREPLVDLPQVQKLYEGMSLVGVKSGLWLTTGLPTSPALVFADKHGIRLVRGEELSIMVDHAADTAGLALVTLAPHLSRYNRSVAGNAAELLKTPF